MNYMFVEIFLENPNKSKASFNSFISLCLKPAFYFFSKVEDDDDEYPGSFEAELALMEQTTDLFQESSQLSGAV